MTLKSIVNNKYTLWSLMLLGAALRFLRIGSADLWRDEAFSLRVADHSISKTISIIAHDTAPPLHSLTLHYWIRLFGTSEAAVRLPSAIFGALTIFVVYKLVKRLTKNTTIQFLVLLLTCINPALIWYSQEARAYSMFTFFALFSLYFTIIIIQEKSISKISAIGLLLTTILGLYTHNLFLFIGFINLSLIVNNLISFRKIRNFRAQAKTHKDQLIRLFMIYLLAGVAYLPWFIIMLRQLQTVNTEGFWLKFHPLTDIFKVLALFYTGELSPILFPPVITGAFILLWLVGALLIMASFLPLKHKDNRSLHKMWFWGILTLVWLYAFNTSFFYIRYLIFLTPIALFLSIETLNKIYKKYKLIAATLLLALLSTTILIDIAYFIIIPDTKAHQRELNQDIDYQANDLILHSRAFTHHSFNVYSDLPNYIYNPEDNLLYYEGLAVINEDDYYKEHSIQGYDRVWVLYLWSPKKQVTRELERNYNLKYQKDYQGKLHLELWEQK